MADNDAVAATADTTAPPPAEPPLKRARVHTGAPFLEAAAMLFVWSILVVNEGAQRFNTLTANPFPSLGSVENDIRIGVYFFGGLFEVVFGFLGLFVAGAALVFRFYNDTLTKAAMGLQSLMGWYVFIVFVFVRPAANAANLTVGDLGLSLGLTRFLHTMGILTAMHFCLALQGGQFLFFARLVSAANDSDFLKQKTGGAMRGLFWNANMALAGLWTFIAGCVLEARVDDALLDAGAFYAFAPQVGAEPAFTIFVGLLLLLYGLYGVLAVAVSALPTGRPYYLAGVVVYLFAFLNWGIAQLALLPGSNGGAIAELSGLVFMTMVLGPYFTWHATQAPQKVADHPHHAEQVV